ncbi:MAG: CoA transferase [Deltaproteobacteria bacterium]|nr:CoA transferase [Deltaproteobacteria bacterium]
MTPLEGIRILEWGIAYAGPGASAILSDLGAEVIKIEQPIIGDPTRYHSASRLEIEGDANIIFHAANRGKKSITVDLVHADGRKIIYDMAAKSDVFLTNLRGTTINRMKMDYPSLARVNPRIIYARVSAYGTRGADADRGGYDPQGQARSGMMYMLKEAEPRMIPGGVVDHSTAIMASYQIMIALFMRERLGIGQEVDVSLLGSASYLMYLDNLLRLSKRLEREGLSPLRSHYQCRDGEWLILRMPDKDWPRVCRLLGVESPENDQKFKDMEKRPAHAKELIAIFRTAFAGKTRSEWLSIFGDTNLIICAVNKKEDALNDPQMVENGYVMDIKHPDMGDIRIPTFPIRFSKAEVMSQLTGPKLGENTFEILHDLLSYPEEDIADLKERGVI